MDWAKLRRELLDYYGSLDAPGGGSWPEGAAESLPFGYGPHQTLLSGLRRIGRVWANPADNDPLNEELAGLYYCVSTVSEDYVVVVSFVGPYAAAYRSGDRSSARYVISRASRGLPSAAARILDAIEEAGLHALTLDEMRTRTGLNVSEFKNVDVYQALFVNHSPAPLATELWDSS